MSLEIQEILRRSDQGMTRPFICRSVDGDIYFVKGRDATRRSQICEWVAGRLAEVFGLPIAPFALVNVSEELADDWASLGPGEIGKGPAFGSLKCQIKELTPSEVDQVPEAVQQDVLVFDWWVKNTDRTLGQYGGNANLFWSPADSELVVIDHNLAFDPAARVEYFTEHHVFARQTSELSGDFFRHDEYHDRFGAALDVWPDIMKEIPEAWWFLDPEETVATDFDPAEVYSLLKRYTQKEFWMWK